MRRTTVIAVLSALLVLVARSEGKRRADCPEFCPALVDPVCAVESGNPKGERPFDNDCLRRQYNCKNKTHYKRLPYTCHVYIPENNQIITRLVKMYHPDVVGKTSRNLDNVKLPHLQ